MHTKNKELAAYFWSCVDKKDVEKKIDDAEGNLDRVQKFIDEFKPSKKQNKEIKSDAFITANDIFIKI